MHASMHLHSLTGMVESVRVLVPGTRLVMAISCAKQQHYAKTSPWKHVLPACTS
jgi:hypothetical protein